jgi:peptidyl-prolyl cis-trans isomerase B (cyclophilin B)
VTLYHAAPVPPLIMRSIVLALAASLILLTACGTSTPSPESDTMPDTDTITDTRLTFDGELLSGKHTVVFKTSLGDITVQLNADAAPKTVTNFVTLAKNGYYDNLLFHRIIPDFMIQGGDPEGTGGGGKSVFGDTFEDEMNAESYGLDIKKLAEVVSTADLKNLPESAKKWSLKQYYEAQGYSYDDSLHSLPMVRGAIAMANRGPNTNGSQFFIIHGKNTEWLEGKHTVFGNVTQGLDVLDTIAAVETGANDKPVEDVTFSVEVIN